MAHMLKLVAVAIIFLTMASACARTGGTTANQPPSLPLGETPRSLSYGGRERRYILYTPTSINRSQPVALVFVLHGGLGNAKTAISMSSFNRIANQNGFVVIYPNGTSRMDEDTLLTWNAGTCCGYAQEKNVDDVGFVRAIVADLQSLADIDPKRIYATGMSNGAMLAQRLACEATDLFAAVAPVAGTLNFSPCHPARPIPIIMFHGTVDQHVPYDGGIGSQSLANVSFTSVPDSVRFWVTANRCDSQPQQHTFDDIRHESWMGCKDSTAVELYSIIGGGHVWPGGRFPNTTQTISASRLIWEFFAAHPKP